MKQLLHTPEGVRDIFTDECTRKLILQDNLHNVLKLYGYHDIETPTFEYFDVFGKDVGTIPSKELYKFFDREGETLVLRPDITPSIARVSASVLAGEPVPQRLCYIGKTFINHSSYQGRLKETTQLGAELIGEPSARADAEMIAMVIESLLKAGLTDFQVSIGQVNFYKSLVEEAGMDEETELKLKDLIINKNHFAVEDLLQEQNISPELKSALLQLPDLFGGEDTLKAARTATENKEAHKAIDRLEEVYHILKLYKLNRYISFDFGMVGNYMYYTGVIFRAFTFGTGGAVVKGGRYDNLLATFGSDRPAIGFVIVLDELMSALSRQKIEIPVEKTNTMVLYKPEYFKIALQLTTLKREQGLNVELMEKGEDKELDVYKEFASDHHIGGILFLEDGKNIRVINLLKDTEETVALTK